MRKIGLIGNHAREVVYWLDKLACWFYVDAIENMTPTEIVASMRELAIRDLEYWCKWWTDLGYGDFMQVFRCTDPKHPKECNWEIVPMRQLVSSVISVYHEYLQEIKLSNAQRKKENRVDQYDPENNPENTTQKTQTKKNTNPENEKE